MKPVLAALACTCLSSIAAAQAAGEDTPPNVKTERVRIALGAGFSAVVGPDALVDGERVEEENPGSLPMPGAVARVELVLSELFLVGVQSSLVLWQATSDEYFGGDWHYTVDVSALLRLRISAGSYERHEFLASIPFGPSFDMYEPGPRTYGAEVTHHLGWHTGLFGGYQYSPVQNPIGFFVEAGLIYHQVSLSFEYENATEEISYQPIEALIRGGMMIPLR